MSSFIAVLMEAVFFSETSVYFNEATRRYIPEASHLYPRRYGTLKSHICDSASKETWVSQAVSMYTADLSILTLATNTLLFKIR
jgi:hypothetical protein